MAVKRRRVQALHVIQRDGWVDHETEQTGSNHIPEGDCDEKVDWPAVARCPCRQPASAQVIDGGVSDHDQGHNFERAERSSEGQCHRWRSAEIKVMSRSDDATGKIN